MNESDSDHMDYFEVAPRPQLEPYVKCFWGLRMNGAPPEPQRVLPDGCCELVLHCGDQFRQHDANGSSYQPHKLFVGPSASAIVISPGASVDIVAIRFHPGGAALLFSAPLSTLRDHVLDLDIARISLGGDLLDALTPMSNGERVEHLEMLLMRRLGRARADRVVEHARRAIERTRGRVRVETIAAECGLSLRGLQRRFREQVGLSPKTLARITRLQHAVTLASTPGSTLARVALRAGYADQAHFTREFHHAAGVTPSEFFRGTHALNDLFFAEDPRG